MGAVSCSLSPQRSALNELEGSDLAVLDQVKAALKGRKDLTLQDVYKKFTAFQRYNVSVSTYSPNPSTKDLRRVARAVTIYQKLFKKEYNDEGQNGPLFMLLALARKAGPPEDKTLHDHATEVVPVPMEWYQVNAAPQAGFVVYLAHLAILELPEVVTDLRPFKEDFYTMLIGNKHFPVCQKTTDQWDFVLKNFDAFCSVEGTKKTLDLDWFNVYDVQKGHHKYGGVMVMDGSNITINGFKPSDGAKWDEAKYVFCSTFGAHVEHGTHGCVLHIAVMQRHLMEVLSDADLQALCKQNAEFETMVKILTCGMNETNINFKLLAGYGRSLAQRSSSFTIDGIDKFSRDLYDKWTAMDNEETVKCLGTGADKWSKASETAWELAQELVDTVTPEDASISDDTKSNLALMLYASSFFHTLVGDLQSDNLMRGHMNMVCTGKPHVQSRSFAVLAGSMVNMIIKRTLSLEEIVKDIELGSSKDAWAKFANGIKNLDTGINTYDKMLSYPAVNF